MKVALICGIIIDMRLVVDKFEILTDKKLEKPLKVILISDVHAGNLPLMSGKENFSSTLRGLRRLRNIDFFALCGDYINNAEGWLDSKAGRNFREFLTKLAEIAPVIMTRGNHDIFLGREATDKGYLDLTNIDNVFLLDNKQMDFLGIKITGFMPQHEAYRLSKHGTTAERLVTEDFKKAGFKFREEDFNLVLTHSPYSLVNSVIFEKFPDFFKKCDLVLSGHLHNGLFLSHNFEKFTKFVNKTKSTSGIRHFIAKNSDWGIWFGVKTGFMISHCRGAKLVNKDETSLPILPSSKRFIKIDLTKNKDKLVQIISKAIIKYSFLPIIHGRPSVVAIKITPKKGVNGAK